VKTDIKPKEDKTRIAAAKNILIKGLMYKE
jgi:hypothetical protein